MTKDEALKLALETFVEINKLSIGERAIALPAEIDTAMDAIKQVLEQPERVCVECGDKLMSDFTKVCYACGHKPEPSEPVVWMYQDKSTHAVSFQKHMRGFVDHGATYETPLYTTPPKREPLTDEQIVQTIDASGIELDDDHVLSDQTIYYVDASTLKGLARAIEQAHGIGEKT
jgi:hypothetical protein